MTHESAVLLVFLAAAPCLMAQEGRAADLGAVIDSLDVRYATRMKPLGRCGGSCPRRGCPPHPGRAQHADQFVRPRALVLLTAFNDRATPDPCGPASTTATIACVRPHSGGSSAFPIPAHRHAARRAEHRAGGVCRPALVRASPRFRLTHGSRRRSRTRWVEGWTSFRSASLRRSASTALLYAVPGDCVLAALEGPLQMMRWLALGGLGIAGRSGHRIPDERAAGGGARGTGGAVPAWG